jgi:hypothetical protein
MKVKRNSGYKSIKDKPIKLVLDINTLDIMCRYAISSSSLIRMSHVTNLRKLVTSLDRSTYENDPEKKKRIEFMEKALEARIEYHLTDRNMILSHANGTLPFELDFVDYKSPELNKNELAWVNQLISETIQYNFMYDKMPQLQDICTRFNSSDYSTRGGIVKEFEKLIDELKNDFRHSKVENNSNEMTFSLREGVFESCVTDVYNTITNPNHRLISGMSGLNEMIGGGFESGRVYMLFGIGGIGKSLTLLNLLTQIKKYNTNYKTKDPTKTPCVVLLTMENTMIDTISRLFSLVDNGVGYIGDYTLDEVINILRTSGRLVVNSESPIDIVVKYRPNKSEDTSYFYTLCDDLEDDGYEVICFIQDHIKRIRSIYGNPDIRIELGDIVNEMKVFAADRDIPVISVSHLNRDATKIVEDGAAKGGTTDITLKMGKSNVGESLLMIDNLDCGIIINLDFDQDGNRYLCYNLIKMRDKTARTYIAQPFTYGSTIRLAEDVGQVPVFKESLHMAPGLNRNSSIRTNSATTIMNLDTIINDSDSDMDNAFSNASIYYDLNKTVEEAPEREIICPIYFIEDSKPDLSKLNILKDKIRQMRVPEEVTIEPELFMIG